MINNVLPKKMEEWFVVGTLVLMMNAFISVLTISPEAGIAGVVQENIWLQIVLIAVYLITLMIFILPNFSKFIPLCYNNLLLIITIVFVLLSSLWSADFLFTFKKAMALALTTIFGFFLIMHYSMDEIISFLGKAFIIVIVSSIAMAIIMPDVAVHWGGKHNGNWRGVFPHKQVLGQVATLATGFFLVFRQRYRFAYLYFLLSFIVLIMSQSRTAAVITFFIIALFFLGKLLAKFPLYLRLSTMVMMAVVILLCGTWISLYFGVVMDALGRDVTLSGRTELWDFAFEYGKNNPLLGVGYRSFWGENTEMIMTQLNYSATSAHNSFLDLWLEIGLVGLSLFIIIFLITIKRAIQLLKKHYDPHNIFSLVFLLYVIGLSAVAVVFPMQNSYLWVFFVVIYCYVNPKYIPVK